MIEVEIHKVSRLQATKPTQPIGTTQFFDELAKEEANTTEEVVTYAGKISGLKEYLEEYAKDRVITVAGEALKVTNCAASGRFTAEPVSSRE